jgi:hypothetical protein
VDLFSCIGTPIAYILAYVTGALKHVVSAVYNDYWAAATGTIGNVRKRELLNSVNADFVHGLHSDSSIARHVGFANRGKSMAVSPFPLHQRRSLVARDEWISN